MSANETINDYLINSQEMKIASARDENKQPIENNQPIKPGQPSDIAATDPRRTRFQSFQRERVRRGFLSDEPLQLVEELVSEAILREQGVLQQRWTLGPEVGIRAETLRQEVDRH